MTQPHDAAYRTSARFGALLRSNSIFAKPPRHPQKKVRKNRRVWKKHAIFILLFSFLYCCIIGVSFCWAIKKIVTQGKPQACPTCQCHKYLFWQHYVLILCPSTFSCPYLALNKPFCFCGLFRLLHGCQYYLPELMLAENNQRIHTTAGSSYGCAFLIAASAFSAWISGKRFQFSPLPLLQYCQFSQ